ncbi:uncharacterized protein YALI1_A14691g [Yarrowia lipolytica]|uniref:Uncharacterized protein n=1 Tax=Yarrowia lipolytica TaxID=4952 RepID=A0A1D8N4U4_YARLL|nr:hypothetical protein YALI1_A14691g [Yarrowia lipolytica]
MTSRVVYVNYETTSYKYCIYCAVHVYYWLSSDMGCVEPEVLQASCRSHLLGPHAMSSSDSVLRLLFRSSMVASIDSG